MWEAHGKRCSLVACFLTLMFLTTVHVLSRPCYSTIPVILGLLAFGHISKIQTTRKTLGNEPRQAQLNHISGRTLVPHVTPCEVFSTSLMSWLDDSHGGIEIRVPQQHFQTSCTQKVYPLINRESVSHEPDPEEDGTACQ